MANNDTALLGLAPVVGIGASGQIAIEIMSLIIGEGWHELTSSSLTLSLSQAHRHQHQARHDGGGGYR